jgi:hypothetical protein
MADTPTTNSMMLEDDAPVPVSKVSEEPAEPKVSWVDTMLSLYSEGMGDSEVRKELGITRAQFDEYCQTVPAFAALVERGREYAEAWWWSAGRKNIKNKDFVVAIWQQNMTNRYGWSNKRESPAETTINVDKLREELRKALPDMAAMLNVITPEIGRKAVVSSLERK